jgi:hypothetical protein
VDGEEREEREEREMEKGGKGVWGLGSGEWMGNSQIGDEEWERGKGEV